MFKYGDSGTHVQTWMAFIEHTFITQEVIEIFTQRMKRESLREKVKSCSLSHLCTPDHSLCKVGANVGLSVSEGYRNYGTRRHNPKKGWEHWPPVQAFEPDVLSTNTAQVD